MKKKIPYELKTVPSIVWYPLGLFWVCVCVIYEYFKEIFMSVDMNI